MIRNFRPRFSLLNALLLMTIVGLSIGVIKLSREVKPMRAEVQKLREETGALAIKDSKKIHAIKIPTFEQDAWKWRIYLPPGRDYTLQVCSGRLPNPQPRHDKEWFEEVRKSGSGSGLTPQSFNGEFTLEARTIKEGNDWVLVTKYTKPGDAYSISGGGKTSIWQPSGDWLSDRRARGTSSDLGRTQKEFESGSPILLIFCQRPIIKETPGGGFTSKMPTGSADGFAVWLEPAQQSAIPPSSNP